MRERVGYHAILIPCYITVDFLSIFFDFSSSAIEISLFLSTLVRRLNLVAVNLSLKIRKLFHEMAISLQNCRVKWQNSSVLVNWTNSALSFHYLVKLLNNLTGLLFLHSTAPCGRPLAFVKFLHSLTLSQYHFCISVWPCPRHNTRSRSLQMLVPRKKWTVTQLTGVYDIVRVPRNRDCTRLAEGSLLQW